MLTAMPALIGCRGRAATLVLVAAALLATVAPARAETVPAGAVMQIEGRVDPAAVARFLTLRYRIEPSRVVAADTVACVFASSTSLRGAMPRSNSLC